MRETHQNAIATIIDKYSDGEGFHTTTLESLSCIKAYAPSLKMPVLYKPSLCLIVQGAKEVLLEDRLYRYGPADFLAVAVNLPVTGQVTEASRDKPYLSLQVTIDPSLLNDVLQQSGLDFSAAPPQDCGLFIGAAEDAFIETMARFVRLLETPRDIPVLAPMLLREMYYHVLKGPHGAAFAQVAVNGSVMQRIGHVLHRLKTEFAQPIRIEEMAETARMSPSSFHHHFKEVTAMTPLQYQKRLRLMEARRLMLAESIDASSTAYRVGYESPSHFSRDYARLFGAPPGRDIDRIRHVNDGTMRTVLQA